jgi:hypothetical protein
VLRAAGLGAVEAARRGRRASSRVPISLRKTGSRKSASTRTSRPRAAGVAAGAGVVAGAEAGGVPALETLFRGKSVRIIKRARVHVACALRVRLMHQWACWLNTYFIYR